MAGGLLDQPYRRLQTMLQTKNIYDIFHLYANYQDGDVAFSRQHPDAWNVVTLMDAELRANGQS